MCSYAIDDVHIIFELHMPKFALIRPEQCKMKLVWPKATAAISRHIGSVMNTWVGSL